MSASILDRFITADKTYDLRVTSKGFVDRNEEEVLFDSQGNVVKQNSQSFEIQKISPSPIETIIDTVQIFFGCKKAPQPPQVPLQHPLLEMADLALMDLKDKISIYNKNPTPEGKHNLSAYKEAYEKIRRVALNVWHISDIRVRSPSMVQYSFGIQQNLQKILNS